MMTGWQSGIRTQKERTDTGKQTDRQTKTGPDQTKLDIGNTHTPTRSCVRPPLPCSTHIMIMHKYIAFTYRCVA